jgi:hypothetical protein
LIIRIHTVTDDNYNDLFIIGIDNPATVTDTIGKNIHAVTSIRNQSNDSFANVNITLKVRNSQGEITETFIEMIGYIAPMETISYTFTKSYMVPNDSLYDLMIYIDSYDNYPENDTVILWRTIYNNNILYYVTVTANDTNMGRVSGDGYYAENTDTSIVAIPNNGCRFVQWNDGNTQNPRTITVTQDTMFTAIFDSVRYNLSLNINDISRGVVSGNGTYAVNSIATITAVPNVGYRFVGWDDGNKDSVRIITVTRNISLIALFGIEGMYYVYAAPTDPKMGSVIGSNDYHKSNGKPEFKREYAANSVASIEAIPNTGYRFIAWNDGNTDNPREFTVTGDSIFMAIFDIGTAIEDIETSNIKLYPNPTTNNIHITLPQNVDHAVFTLYDMQGKILIKQNINNQDAISVSNLAAGIYIYNVTTDKENHVGKLKIKN